MLDGTRNTREDQDKDRRGANFKCGKDLKEMGCEPSPDAWRAEAHLISRYQSTGHSLEVPKTFTGKAARSKLSLEQKLKMLSPLHCVDICMDGAKALVNETAGSSAPEGQGQLSGQLLSTQGHVHNEKITSSV